MRNMTEIDIIVNRVFRDLPFGRHCTFSGPAQEMMKIVQAAGHGDHLEIGVLHGATAIMAALTKEWFGLRGQVICVDPLQGYYSAGPIKPNGVTSERGQHLTKEVDPITKVPVSPETFFDNVRFFGMENRIVLVREFSYPWPERLEDSKFVSAYIDGDHYQDGPTKDWESVFPRIEPGGYVMFDDCNENCPGVLAAAEVAKVEPGWHFVSHPYGQTFIVQKDEE